MKYNEFAKHIKEELEYKLEREVSANQMRHLWKVLKVTYNEENNQVVFYDGNFKLIEQCKKLEDFSMLIAQLETEYMWLALLNGHEAPVVVKRRPYVEKPSTLDLNSLC